MKCLIKFLEQHCCFPVRVQLCQCFIQPMLKLVQAPNKLPELCRNVIAQGEVYIVSLFFNLYRSITQLFFFYCFNDVLLGMHQVRLTYYNNTSITIVSLILHWYGIAPWPQGCVSPYGLGHKDPMQKYTVVSPVLHLSEFYPSIGTWLNGVAIGPVSCSPHLVADQQNYRKSNHDDPRDHHYLIALLLFMGFIF